MDRSKAEELIATLRMLANHDLRSMAEEKPDSRWHGYYDGAATRLEHATNLLERAIRQAAIEPQLPPAQDLGGHTVEVEHEAVRMAREAMQPPPAKGCGPANEDDPCNDCVHLNTSATRRPCCDCSWLHDAAGDACAEDRDHWQANPTPAAKPAACESCPRSDNGRMCDGEVCDQPASGNDSGNGCPKPAAEPGVRRGRSRVGWVTKADFDHALGGTICVHVEGEPKGDAAFKALWMHVRVTEDRKPI